MKTCYELLGVEFDAPLQKIRARYRLLARQYHPDLAANSKQFQQYAQAYHMLSNYERRKAYNHSNGIFVEPRPLLPGQHSYQRLTIPAELATTGGKAHLTYLLYEPCPRCWLAGCERCEGRGMLPEQVEIDVPISPGSKSGKTVFVEGRGARSEPGGPRGDLFVYVYIGAK